MLIEKERFYFIYKTTNLINGKYYYGMHSTVNLNDGYIGSGKRLWNSINKYGIENFKFEIIKFLSSMDLMKEEERKIVNDDLLKDPNCMNLKVGGIGGFSNEQQKINGKNGIKRYLELMEIPEWKENQVVKISVGLKKYLSLNNKNGMWDGKTHTEGTKKLISDKLSEIRKGENNTQFGTCWITNGKENKKIKKEQDIPLGWKKGRVLKKKLD